MLRTKVLVTGTAGFIGFHLAKRLLESGVEVVGLDNINEYYDVRKDSGSNLAHRKPPRMSPSDEVIKVLTNVGNKNVAHV